MLYALYLYGSLALFNVRIDVRSVILFRMFCDYLWCLHFYGGQLSLFEI